MFLPSKPFPLPPLSFPRSYDSDVISHYFQWSAYMCGEESFSSVEELSGEVQEACQTLANMCVMQLYDLGADVCDKYEAIMNARDDGEYQDSWMKGMPWLYYDNDANFVREDRSIRMRVSFNEIAGYTNQLKYKLVKFSIDGKLLAVEDLSTHFS